MRKIAYFCFVVAGLAGFAGMSLGIWMSVNHDVALAPVHAHTNLLGWVTLSLYGLYHRGVDRRDTRLAWLQVGSGALGFAMLTIGMYALLGPGIEAVLPIAITGSFLCLGSMALFVFMLVLDARGWDDAVVTSGGAPVHPQAG